MVAPPLTPDLFNLHGAGPFATADWQAITALIRAEPETVRPRLWHAAALHWAESACDVLNKFVDPEASKPLPYRLGQSARFIVLAPSYEGAETRWPDFGEWALNGMLPFLSPVAAVPPWPLLAIFLHNIPTFDMYVTALDDSTTLLPGGVYISGKQTPPHVAILGTMHLLGLRVVFIHELVHTLVNHVGMPLWLEEGICRHLEGVALRTGVIFLDERDPKRNYFWRDHGLETFWKGTCFGHAGAHEAYVLAMRIVRHLLERGNEQFFRFARLAKIQDAGFAAFQDIYGDSLESLAAKLIGRAQ